ncbi:MAG: hypothetical protein FJX75_08225 [Armatimonadetes bacterium]|nr:hypothetical protein [Armatimonadota bacterium]
MKSSRTLATWMLAGLMTLGAILCPPRPAIHTQGIEEEELSAEVLQRDIHFLQMLMQLKLTGEQRASAAKAIEAFHQKREATLKLAEPPELLTALSAIREALLKGQAPTPAMREAVEAARPRDEGSLDKAFTEARQEVLTALESVLTDDQKEQLGILPLIGVAEEVIGMCLHSRELDTAEAREMRLNAFPEIRDQLAFAAGDGSQRVLGDFQSLINRISALTPEQVEPQREQLIAQIVTLLKTTFDKNPEMSAERLRDQLWGWVTEPRVHALLRGSAAAMGAQ